MTGPLVGELSTTWIMRDETLFIATDKGALKCLVFPIIFRLSSNNIPDESVDSLWGK